MPLPVNPTSVDGLMGKDFLIDINTGTVETPTWSLIGGQRSGSLKRTAEEIDGSNKTTGGWSVKKAGLRSWSLEAGSIVVLTDAGADALDEAFNAGKEVNVRFRHTSGISYIGWGSITDYSLDAPHDDIASLSITISGNGPLELE